MPTPLLSLPLLLLNFGFGDDQAFAPPEGDDATDAGSDTSDDGQDTSAEDDAPPSAADGDAPEEGADDAGDAPAPDAGDSDGAADVDGAEPSTSSTAAAGDDVEAEGPVDTEDLGLDDIFGDPEELEIEELGESEDTGASSSGGGGGSIAPSKWEHLDARVRVVSSIYMDVDDSYNGERFSPDFDGRGDFSRHETRLEFYLNYAPNDHIAIVADIEPVFLKYPEPLELGDLTDRFQLAPFHVESDAAYVHIIDALPGLDFKFGRQIVLWGTADKFNPTNNINPDDLEDRPLFTEPIANQMAVVDFNPWNDKLWFQGVYVPWFVPALLPPSATVALQDSQGKIPYVNEDDYEALEYLQGFIIANPKFDPIIYSHVNVPNRKFTNGQAAVKLGSSLGPVDFSGSYYYGFHDIPLPVDVESTQLNDLMLDAEDLPEGETHWYRSDVSMIYPRMHVWGLDFATQLGFLGNAGLWGEGAIVLPAQKYTMRTDLPVLLDVTPNDGMANPIREINGAVVGGNGTKAHPFLKATVGADYTIGKHVYLQAQYLRGMIDQFGAGNIDNFLVAGGDLVFFGRHLVFRTFGVVEFPEIGVKGDKPSAAIAPNLIMVPPWGFLTFEIGGFALIGAKDTYFGAPYTGSSIVHFKATGQF